MLTATFKSLISSPKHFFSSKVFSSASEACKDIKSGSSILVGGWGLTGYPENSVNAIHKMGLRELKTVSNNIGLPDFGIGLWVQSKQVNKVTASFFGESAELYKQYLNGEVEIEVVPQGTLAEKLRSGGVGIPAFYTPTGLSTILETGGWVLKYKEGGGKAERIAKPKPKVKFNGKDFLMEETITGDVALIRATKGDKHGNLMFDKGITTFNGDMAAAGRITIAEVEELVEIGELKPKEIHVPGVFVHRIYQGSNYTKQFSGAIVAMFNQKENFVRRKIAQRAAKEVLPGMNLNLGIGIPTLTTKFIPKEWNVFVHSENGLLGVSALAPHEEADSNFDLTNASIEKATLRPGASIFSSSTAFGIIRGDHLDMTFIGAMQVSANGDVANWNVPGKRLIGIGGAMDLVSSNIRVVALMEHTSKDRHKILEKCTLPLTGVNVVKTIITELAVFDIIENELVLREIATETTLDEVTKKTGAPFKIANNLVKF